MGTLQPVYKSSSYTNSHTSRMKFEFCKRGRVWYSRRTSLFSLVKRDV